MTKPRRSLPVLGSPAPSTGADLARVKSAGRDAVRVGFVTLGCDKNTVDSERMLARMLGAGATLSSDPADADVVVVNTCGFIESAKEESIEAILEAAKLKQSGRVRAVKSDPPSRHASPSDVAAEPAPGGESGSR